MRGRLLAVLAALPLVVLEGGEAWARGGRGHGAHRSSPRTVFVRPAFPRTVFFAAPFVYAATPYYYPPPVYAAPPPYYGPVPGTPPSFYDPPAAPGSYPPAPPSYAPQPSYGPESRGAPSGPYSVEQGMNYRYFCPDSRLYYPEVRVCPSGWLTVLPGASRQPR